MELIRLKSLSLNQEEGVSEDIRELIRTTPLGNPDGIRYRHLDSMRKIDEIEPLQFFSLRKDNSLLFSMAIAERLTKLGSSTYHTFNIRYVVFNSIYRAKALNTESFQDPMQRIGNSFIKEGMKQHAELYKPILSDFNAQPEKKVYYAFVEDSNLRSLNLTGFFLEPLRKVSITTFSRFFPRKNKHVKACNKNKWPTIRKLIDTFYQHHSFYFLEDRRLPENYFVYEQDGIILAGVKAEIANWKIVQLPGFFGKILVKIMPFLPLFSRLIKPETFRFLTFDTLYCQPGNEKYLPVLFESVCSILKTNTAMIYLDSKDPLQAPVSEFRSMGLLNRLFKTAEGNLLVRFINFSAEETEKFKNFPAYISGYDLS